MWIKTREIRSTEKLDLAFCDRSAVNLGLANSYRAVDRPVGILKADGEAAHLLTGVNSRDRPYRGIGEILDCVTQGLLIPQTLSVAYAHNLASHLFQTSVKTRVLHVHLL